MSKFSQIFRFRWVPFLIVTLVVSLFVVVKLRHRIAENKYARAKMDIFETFLTTPEDERKDRIRDIIDSTFFSRDTTGVE